MRVDSLIVFSSNEDARNYSYSFGITDLLSDWNSSFFKRRETLVLTGTCLGEGPNKVAIDHAAKLGLRSKAVVDHWSWYRKRFEVSDGLLLPDRIIVNDSIALEEVINDGLPPDRLVALGNPVLELVAN